MKIGILIDSLEESCQYNILRGIWDAPENKDFSIVVFIGEIQLQFHGIDIHYENITDHIENSKLNGLIIFSGSISDSLRRKELNNLYTKLPNIPTVTISSNDNINTSVTIDNTNSFKKIISHLIEVHGCKKLAYINGPKDHEECEERFKAYLSVLNSAGIEYDPALVIDTNSNFSDETGKKAITILLDKRAVDFDSIITADDSIAIGAIDALNARGIKVPDDIAIVGFDDIDEAINTIPSLTTVRQPFFKIGRTALLTLLNKITKNTINQNIIIKTEPIIRQSCGCKKDQTHIITQISEKYNKNKVEDKNLRNFHTVSQILLSIYNFHELINVLYKSLPRLHISRCFIVLYKTKPTYSDNHVLEIPEYSKLYLAYNETGNLLLDGAIEFPTKEFIPLSISDSYKSSNFIFMVLAFKEEHYGYILCEYTRTEPAIMYELLRNHITSAIHNSLLLDKLNESNEQKSEFLVNFSHEIKTPLTIISNTLSKYIKKKGRNDEISLIKQNFDSLQKNIINPESVQKIV